ncbi:MAG: ribonuclease P protein component [Lachnospiraceae bacterium]|jgi:ribonuclease P protein component|nr:ribonuclease P protein component [Lachnospiraceae bacterium]
MKNPYSLRKNADFKKVYDLGKSRADKYLVMYIFKNGLEINRLGISVSKKVGNSVIRHHVTRLVREAYRVNENLYKKGYDIVVIGRVSSSDASFHNIEHSMRKLADSHHILQKME